MGNHSTTACEQIVSDRFFLSIFPSSKYVFLRLEVGEGGGFEKQFIITFINLSKNTKHPNLISPFHATGLFLYPLKTSENQKFSDVSRGFKKRSMAWNGLMWNQQSSICWKCFQKVKMSENQISKLPGNILKNSSNFKSFSYPIWKQKVFSQTNKKISVW